MRLKSFGIRARCAVVGLLALGAFGSAPAALAAVTAVKGSAYGYFSNVGLFGGPLTPRGPAPTVTLPAAGSVIPITATVPTGSAAYGPAILFSSGPLTVSTQGTTGATGSVTSSSNIMGINPLGQQVFTATNVLSACTATEAGVSGSTTITGGTLQTSEGNPNVEGDETVVTIPINPAVNTEYTGKIESVGDNFRYVFNEQIINPDGSITVNAAHQYLLGPMAVGELIIGQSVCGVTTMTAVTFRSLSADRSTSGVHVRWRTVSEIDTLGFNVWREVNGKRVRANAKLIAGKGRGIYSFLDRRATKGNAVRYWIQAVNLDGSRRWHGPARVSPRR